METSGECSKGYLVLSHRTSTSKSIFSNVRLQPKHSFTTLPATIPKHTVGGCCLLSLEYHFNSSMSKLCTHCKVYWIRRRICFGHPIKLQFHSSWWGVLILRNCVIYIIGLLLSFFSIATSPRSSSFLINYVCSVHVHCTSFIPCPLNSTDVWRSNVSIILTAIDDFSRKHSGALLHYGDFGRCMCISLVCCLLALTGEHLKVELRNSLHLITL